MFSYVNLTVTSQEDCNQTESCQEVTVLTELMGSVLYYIRMHSMMYRAFLIF
jgi:hypothetical protein